MIGLEQMKQVAIEAAYKAGKILKTGFGTTFKINSKEGRNNLVTEYDYAAEEAIISHIKSVFPTHSFLAEESGVISGSSAAILATDEHATNRYVNNISSELEKDIRWIIDPLDGTVNFAHSIPIFSVSIAVEVAGILHIGVIYDPMLDEMFVAVRDFGATLNGVAINTSKNTNMSSAICVTGFPYVLSEKNTHSLDIFCKFVRNGNPVRRLGSAALDLAYVAAGRFDFFWEEKLQPWDVAAGVLLVNEAGGCVTTCKGDSYNIFKKEILATNKILHEECLAIMNS